MNVNNNVITYTTPTKIDTPKQPVKKEEFKKALEDQTLKSKSSQNDDVNKANNKEENLDETTNKNPDKVDKEKQKDAASKTTLEEDTKKSLVSVDTSDKDIEEINNAIKKITELLNQNIKNSSEESLNTDITTDEMAQIQKLLESLTTMLQTTDKTSETKTLITQLNSIDLEGLMGKGKLTSEAKSTLKNNLNKMMPLLEQSLGKSSGEDDSKIINVIKKIRNVLKQDIKNTSSDSTSADKSTDQMAQIQQLVQSLATMIQSINKTTTKTTTTKTSGTELNSINLEELIGVEKLTPETKSTLKNSLSEIVSLLENSKGNSKATPEILSMIQKLTTQVKEIKSDLNLLKVPTSETNSDNSEEKSIKDNLIKMVKSQNTKSTSESISKNQNQSSSDNKKDKKSSGNSSSEEKFLNKLLSADKDDVKISKVVNFMNQFQTVKTLDTTKVLSANLVVNKNNLEADVIKSVKFMEVNNIKDLTVKMNPRELGEITIKLTMESGIMKASILAQNKETYNLLNNNFQDIQDRLKNMDIKIQSLDINVYEDSTYFNKNSSGNNNNNNGKQDKNTKTNVDIDDDVAISSNYAIEDNQVNKFV
ncbi:flagellar hook-length control protein FliK [Clostridium frigoris]|uniref:Flagellar hook-length control protein FliK n=1 Tax=Clostridium frigoris TaxID=205327 RepID=A0ABS6BQH6_9CLOT|nr:flagellar hook-length control protein FliK [Clostridium frigoris]